MDNIHSTQFCDPIFQNYFLFKSDINNYESKSTNKYSYSDTCYTIQKSCCSNEDIKYMERNAIKILRHLKKQENNLKKILFILRNSTYKDFFESLNEDRSTMRQCIQTSEFDFQEDLKELFLGLNDMRSIYEDYIEFNT